jgi:hypothetical protein
MKIEIYPECPKPDWMKVGAWCFCWGEAYDKFIVDKVGKNAAFLLTEGGLAHGWESFKKLHRTDNRSD